MTDEEFRELFVEFGDVQSADIIFDRATNRSKGFGFVTMGDAEQAKAAIAKLDGSEVSGRKIIVNVARPKENR